MSVALTVAFDRNTPELEAYLATARSPRPLMAALGKRLEKGLRSHFLRKNGEPNKRGWPKSNFWSRLIRANTSLTSVTAHAAEVTIAAPEMAQKIFGGTIRPRHFKYLALPAVAAMKGRSPRVVDGLHFEPRRSRKWPELRGVLADAKHQSMFLLATSVTQQADPTALPTEAQTAADLKDETTRFLARVARRGGRN